MKNILFVFSLCAIFILSSCQEAPPAETPELSTSVELEASSQDESISMKSSSIIESSSVTETVQNESIEMSEDNESLDTNHELELNSSQKSLCSSKEESCDSQNEKPSKPLPSQKDESTTKSRHINYLGQMFGYLKKNLDRNDYGFLWWEDNTIFIYVVNEQSVKEVVNNYDDTPVEVEYIPTKYSYAQMDEIIEELENVDFIKQGIERDEVLIMNQRFEPGVLIEWLYEVPQELVDFMETYQYRDCVKYQVAILCPLT